MTDAHGWIATSERLPEQLATYTEDDFRDLLERAKAQNDIALTAYETVCKCWKDLEEAQAVLRDVAHIATCEALRALDALNRAQDVGTQLRDSVPLPPGPSGQ